jgi:predicted RNase H-like HicB family nuclease
MSAPAADSIHAQQPCQRQFRVLVPARADPRHDLGTFGFGKNISHKPFGVNYANCRRFQFALSRAPHFTRANSHTWGVHIVELGKFIRVATSDRFAWVKMSGIKRPLYDGWQPGYSSRAMIVPLSKVQLRQDEDGVWIAKSSLLPGCHAHGRDRGEATLRFQQAAKAHLEALLETGRPIPVAFRDKFVLAA